MKSIREESKLLASLAVFRELYDSKQSDVYAVIGEFLKEIITSNGKYQFNLTEITNLLNNTFEFSIPEAVVNTALRRLDYLQKDQHFYIVKKMPHTDELRVNTLQEQTLNKNNALIEELFSFIESKQSIILPDDEKTKIVQSLHSFLLEESSGTDYSEYISAFAVKNKNDPSFRESLNKIREGVILYSGIKYINLGEMGTWNTYLTIYLDTEILFHFAGYNGKIQKTIFEDFFGYVKEINNRAKKLLIKLEYFKEVTKEIDSFFAKAEYIVDGKDILNPKITAMQSVVDGCRSLSDVSNKKADFYLFIMQNGITESGTTNYFDPSNHKYNIVDQKLAESLSKEVGFDITENLNFLNFVNIQRQGVKQNNFENAGYILLTGNSITRRLAFHEQIKLESTIPLATTLNWITNRFWFKLNKGFGNGDLPISFDVITKAQIVLSSILSKSIGEKYDELQSQYKAGKITDELVKARIIELRSQVKKPEEIQQDDVSQILDVVSEDSLEQFIKEQEAAKNEVLKQSEENLKLKRELSLKKQALENRVVPE